MNSSSEIFSTKWTLWFHSPIDSNWELGSYKKIGTVSNVEEFWSLYKHLQHTIVENGMLFFMKEDALPLWEEEGNINGGCWSFKIYKKNVYNAWVDLSVHMCAGSLTANKIDKDMINGISISPKRNFCILKIWLSTCDYQDPTLITNIKGLENRGCLFKRHNPKH